MKNTGFYDVPFTDDKGRRMYCGRFALIAATGLPEWVFTTAINFRRKKDQNAHIAGTTVNELRHALGKADVQFTSELKDDEAKPTFTQWRKREHHSRTATYILLITGHWIVVRGDWLTDTYHREPHDLSRSNPYARKRVVAVIRLSKS